MEKSNITFIDLVEHRLSYHSTPKLYKAFCFCTVNCIHGVGNYWSKISLWQKNQSWPICLQKKQRRGGRCVPGYIGQGHQEAKKVIKMLKKEKEKKENKHKLLKKKEGVFPSYGNQKHHLLL